MKVHFHQLQLSLHLFSSPSPLALQMGAQPPSCATALPPLHPAFQILPHLHSSCSPGARVSLQLYPPKVPSYFELLLERRGFKYSRLNFLSLVFFILQVAWIRSFLIRLLDLPNCLLWIGSVITIFSQAGGLQAILVQTCSFNETFSQLSNWSPPSHLPFPTYYLRHAQYWAPRATWNFSSTACLFLNAREIAYSTSLSWQ